MSREELLADILRHEKEHRGIAASAPDVAVQAVPEWAIDRNEGNRWRQASGEVIGDMILQRTKIMQVLEVTSSLTGWAQLMLSIGVPAWTQRGYDLYKAARLAGRSPSAAIAVSLEETWEEQRAYVATLVPILLGIIRQQEPLVLMVLVNLTDGLLELQDLTTTHGTQTVQFVEPSGARKALLPLDQIDGLGSEDDTFWLGLLCARKKDLALLGTQGAFSLKPSGQVFPTRSSSAGRCR